MDQLDREDLVRTWIDRHADPALLEISQSKQPDNRFWAWQKLDSLCRDEPELAWSVILEILQRSSSEQVRENLAAGPLENLLTKHGYRFIDRVEAEAWRNADFRELLAGVWQNAMSNELWQRVRAACKEA
jgi:hypothetical protein